MNTFTLTITALEKTIYNNEAVLCQVVTPSGALGLEAKHESFLTILKDNSTITFKEPSGTEKSYQIESGILSFRDNACLITITLPTVAK